MSFPILYSLQHCPYAMRARMGLLLAKQRVYLRAIVLNNKPKEMLEASPKGTVPVLLLDNIRVIDESIDIMIWALSETDPQNLLFQNKLCQGKLYKAQPELYSEMLNLINTNDTIFNDWLKKYKQAKRYHETSEIDYRQQCEVFIAELEKRLTKHDYFMGNNPSLADYAMLPFIRQFSRVDRKWFRESPYPKLQQWLTNHLQSQLYSKIMIKHPLWLDTYENILLE